ncbi:MAG TPA: hypothetical protein IAB46_13440, partial [Candidatus Scybalocola faecigallinarum]|nr:hypothetical protein [Candidatus Scybalocola faecigallinarum]
DEKKLYLGAAPDTFLGAGLQTARKVIDSGLIGQVTSAVGCINRNYVRSSESAPFLCGIGGGLPYDMGIYYTTALLSLLGPVSRVAGFGVRPQGCTGMDPSSGRMGEQWGFKSYNTAAKEMAFHAAELMLGVEQCEKDGRIYEMTSSFTRPLPLKSGFMNTTFEGKVRLDAEGALVQ